MIKKEKKKGFKKEKEEWELKNDQAKYPERSGKGEKGKRRGNG